MPRHDECCHEDLDTQGYQGNFIDAGDIDDVDLKDDEVRKEEELVL
jgi:hypothetical protein